VISWPQRIHEYGAVRSQFSHLIDIAPTILEAAGVPQPKSVFGVTQQPMDGVSLVPWFSPGHAEQPRTQYFQISGAVGIYHDGWFAGAPTGRMPWEFKPPVSADPFDPSRRQWVVLHILRPHTVLKIGQAVYFHVTTYSRKDYERIGRAIGKSAAEVMHHAREFEA